jgi:Flp pilus assembly pilin Flp
MNAFGKLLERVHGDEKGAVSIETILIIAAIALPILIFVLKFGWPRIREFFEQGMEDLEGAAEDAAQDSP